MQILASKDLISIDLNNAEVNAITLDNLKSLIDVRPQVIDDVSIVFEKFPYDNFTTQILFSFVS